jgi:CheY-like chemotaxis protein
MNRPMKILIADDDRLMRIMLDRILLRAGYEVLSVEDGMTAIEKTALEKPDLVVTDGIMPDMHGISVCQAVKQLPSPPKVILLTASLDEEPDAGENLPDEFLMKPVCPDQLIACIEKHLSEQSAV